MAKQTIKVFNKMNPKFKAIYRNVTEVKQIETEAGKIGILVMENGETASFTLNDWVLLHKAWTEID